VSEPTPTVRVGHSPDPDDAFMFYGIASGRVDTGRYRIEQVLEDIETLNRLALAGELEVTAASIHVAVPGTLTSAFLALKLFLGRDFHHDVVPFDRILETVRDGRADAGLIIHEGQLTYSGLDLCLVTDLGAWWAERTAGLPLPLGGNVVRRDLGADTMRDLTRILRASIDYGLAHRAEALDYAMDYGRGLGRDLTDRFVGMYVNDLTREYGERGRLAVARFLDEGRVAGWVPATRVEFVA
jgi:1,4-dihydroxy-6-naphthoate synthase